MPLPLVQRRRHRLALIMIMHLLDIHVRSVWMHPINNLQFEKGEFSCTLIYANMRTASLDGTECQ